MHYWSYGRICAFDDCPYRYYLKYIAHVGDGEQFFASYGRFVHKLLERYYKGELKKEDLQMEYLLGFSEYVKGERPSTEIAEHYFEDGSIYFHEFRPPPIKPLEVEKQVSFKVNGIPFRGVIDLVGELNGELCIVDHKSSNIHKPTGKRKKQSAKDIEYHAKLRQLYFYAEALRQNIGEYPKKLCFNCFRTGNFIQEDFDLDACKEAQEWALKQIDDINTTDDFYPRVNGFACRYICTVCEHCIYHELDRGN